MLKLGGNGLFLGFLGWGWVVRKTIRDINSLGNARPTGET